MNVSMWRTAIRLFLVLTALTGIAYPLVVTAVASSVFPRQASGSFVERAGERIGSELISQPFADRRYFWGRLSATAEWPSNAQVSGGSNLGPLHPNLAESAQSRLDALRAADPRDNSPPIDLVTASASGLDPHISPAAAEYQVRRVARERRVTEQQVRELVRAATEGRQWGVFGEPRVNVLRLNLALDELAGQNGVTP